MGETNMGASLQQLLTESLAVGVDGMDSAFERVAQLEAEVAQLRSEKHELESIARIDSLTGVGNRRAFEETLERSLRLAVRFANPLSVLLLDLDGMKGLNDRYGHAMGDQGLRAVGVALRETLRQSDVPCRCGGDEFAVILPGTNAEGARIVAEKLRAAIAAVAVPTGRGRVRPFTASIGLSTHAGVVPFTKELMEGLVETADAALYRVKHNGKNGVRHADDPADAPIARTQGVVALPLPLNVVSLPIAVSTSLHSVVAGLRPALETVPTRRQRQSRRLRAIRV